MTHVYQLLRESALAQGTLTALTFVERLKPVPAESPTSYARLLHAVRRTARLIRAQLGESRGTVSLLLPNIPQAQAILWAAETVGVAQPLNPMLSEAALFELLRKAESRVIFAPGPQAGSDLWQKVLAVAARLPVRPAVYSVDVAGPDPERHYDRALERHSGEELPDTWLPASGSEIAAIFHTGGTTGTPRLALHTHANQVAAARHAAAGLGLVPGEAIINGLPLFHVAGAIVCSLAPLSVGANIVLATAAGFRNPEVVHEFWALVARHRVVVGGAIPTSLSAIAQVPTGGANLRSLHYFLTGGAPVPESIAAALHRLTARPTYQMYGLTECAGVVTVPGVDKDPVPGSAGRVVAPVEVRIDGAISGEICVRGPSVFAGYLGEPSPVSAEGWLRTGDLGRLDAQGNLFITGRAKDLIIRGGHNIDPAMIESCLESHPEVLMAAAVGWPDAYAGELPVAYVQLRAQATSDAESLREFALAHIDERPAAPKRVIVLDSLPLTTVGKIHKPSLRAMAARDAVREVLCARFPELVLEIAAAQNAQGELEVTVTSEHATQSLRELCEDLAASLRLRIRLDVSAPSSA
ncbi:MAG: AMP-binding protein [Panacagrimonas sp.]